MLKFRPDADETTILRADKAYHKANKLWGIAGDKLYRLENEAQRLNKERAPLDEQRKIREEIKTIKDIREYYFLYMEGIRDISVPDRAPHENLLQIAFSGNTSDSSWYRAAGYHDAYYFDHYLADEDWVRKIEGEQATRKVRIGPPVSGDKELDSFEYY